VRCQLDVARDALLVPQRAVRELQGSYHVLVVGADGTVGQRLVTTAERVGSLWRIASGLQAGELVLVDGLQKVRPGMKVAPQVVAIDGDARQQPAGGSGK
jgi:membrane fusion protein (multidrug efflux system)